MQEITWDVIDLLPTPPGCNLIPLGSIFPLQEFGTFLLEDQKLLRDLKAHLETA